MRHIYAFYKNGKIPYSQFVFFITKHCDYLLQSIYFTILMFLIVEHLSASVLFSAALRIELRPLTILHHFLNF